MIDRAHINATGATEGSIIAAIITIHVVMKKWIGTIIPFDISAVCQMVTAHAEAAITKNTAHPRDPLRVSGFSVSITRSDYLSVDAILGGRLRDLLSFLLR